MSKGRKKGTDRIFVSWTRYNSRSESLARAVGAQSFFCNDRSEFGPFKYVFRAWKTLGLLNRKRPRAVFCINPPYFLALTAYVHCRLRGGILLLDSHSGAFDDPKWTWMGPLYRFVVRRAACCIVTNEELACRVRDMGGDSMVIADIPHWLPSRSYPVSTDNFNVCFVCSFGGDEPLEAVLRAAADLDGVHVYITGDTRNAPKRIRDSVPSPHVTFTGYLNNDDYAGLLQSVDAVMVLTTRDFTMQRGGSEAVTVGKPLITSDWDTLRNIFLQGAVFCDNSASGIKSAIENVQVNGGRLEQEVKGLAEVRAARWEQRRQQLEDLLAWVDREDTGGVAPRGISSVSE